MKLYADMCVWFNISMSAYACVYISVCLSLMCVYVFILMPEYIFVCACAYFKANVITLIVSSFFFFCSLGILYTWISQKKKYRTYKSYKMLNVWICVASGMIHYYASLNRISFIRSLITKKCTKMHLYIFVCKKKCFSKCIYFNHEYDS